MALQAKASKGGANMSRARGSIFGEYLRHALQRSKQQQEQALGEALAASQARTEAITEQYAGRRVTLGASSTDARAEAEKRVIEAAKRLVHPSTTWHTICGLWSGCGRYRLPCAVC